MGKTKKAPKKPVGTKWANQKVSLTPGNSAKPSEDRKPTEGKPFHKSYDRKPNNYGDKPYKKPYDKNNNFRGNKRPARKVTPPGDEHALSTFVKKISDFSTKYLIDTYGDKAHTKLEILTDVNTLQEKYGLVTCRIHIIDYRYKDLLVIAFTDKMRHRCTMTITSDPCEGVRPLYNGSDSFDKFDKLFESYLPHILDSTWKKIQQLNAKYDKKATATTEKE